MAIKIKDIHKGVQHLNNKKITNSNMTKVDGDLKMYRLETPWLSRRGMGAASARMESKDEARPHHPQRRPYEQIQQSQKTWNVFGSHGRCWYPGKILG